MTPIDLLRRDLDNVALRNNAIAELTSLLVDFGGEDIPDDGSYTYDDGDGRAERYMLAGVAAQDGTQLAGQVGWDVDDRRALTVGVLEVAGDVVAGELDEHGIGRRAAAKARNSR